MDLKTLADVRALLKHLPKETREKSTWPLVKAKLEAAGADAVEMFVTLRMVLDLEGVESKVPQPEVAISSIWKATPPSHPPLPDRERTC